MYSLITDDAQWSTFTEARGLYEHLLINHGITPVKWEEETSFEVVGDWILEKGRIQGHKFSLEIPLTEAGERHLREMSGL